MNKCTVGTRHKWVFVRNRTLRSQSFHGITFTRKGLYKCACGETKYGEPVIAAQRPAGGAE